MPEATLIHFPAHTEARWTLSDPLPLSTLHWGGAQLFLFSKPPSRCLMDPEKKF